MFNKMRSNPRSSVKGGSPKNACLLGTSSLIEDDVYDAAGKFLGQIEEIVLDAVLAAFDMPCLGLEGFWGSDESGSPFHGVH